MQAIILAGGKGTRLKPFTNNIPKPLVPLGDQPILEIVLKQLKSFGIDNITIAVNHLAKLIQAFFDDGSSLGINITYSEEDQILGTAGPIRIVHDLEDNFIVMNGDILTNLKYNDLFLSHIKNKNLATIATFKKKVNIDLGVLIIEDGRFCDYIEKPTYLYDVSMGIYVFNKKVVDFIPPNCLFDIPELLLALLKNGESIGCYQNDYEWLDIGRIEDYEMAVDLFERDRKKYLPS